MPDKRMMDETPMAARLEKLEQQNLYFKWGAAAMGAIMVGAALVALLYLIQLDPNINVKPDTADVSTVRTKKVEIVDGSGRVRMILSADKGAPALSLVDDKNIERGRLAQDEEGANLFFWDKGGKAIVELNGSGPALNLEGRAAEVGVYGRSPRMKVGSASSGGIFIAGGALPGMSFFKPSFGGMKNANLSLETIEGEPKLTVDFKETAILKDNSR